MLVAHQALVVILAAIARAMHQHIGQTGTTRRDTTAPVPTGTPPAMPTAAKSTSQANIASSRISAIPSQR